MAHGSAGNGDREGEEEWVRLAWTVPGTLMLVGVSEGVLTDTDAAHSLLVELAAPTRKVADDDEVQHSTGYSAALERLDAAHLAISRLMALHSEACGVFYMCAPHLVFHSDERRGAWEVLRAQVVGHAKKTIDLLWSAVSTVDYALGGVVTWSPKSPSPEAYHLLRRAADEVHEAREEVKLMRDAARREFSEASAILKRA